MTGSVAATTLVRPRARKFSSTKIGDKETDQICGLSQAGWYPDEISDITGRTSKQIELALFNAGYNPRSHKYHRAEVATWVSMYQGTHDDLDLGMSFAAIARETGYSTSTIQLAVLRTGTRDRHPSESRRLAHERRKATRRH